MAASLFFDHEKSLSGSGSGGWRGWVGYCEPGTVHCDEADDRRIFACGKLWSDQGTFPALKMQVWIDRRLPREELLSELEHLLRTQASSGGIALD